MVGAAQRTVHFADRGLLVVEVSRLVEMELTVAKTHDELDLRVTATVAIAEVEWVCSLKGCQKDSNVSLEVVILLSSQALKAGLACYEMIGR